VADASGGKTAPPGDAPARALDPYERAAADPRVPAELIEGALALAHAPPERAAAAWLACASSLRARGLRPRELCSYLHTAHPALVNAIVAGEAVLAAQALARGDLALDAAFLRLHRPQHETPPMPAALPSESPRDSYLSPSSWRPPSPSMPAST
jgi:hypothetical protein